MARWVSRNGRLVPARGRAGRWRAAAGAPATIADSMEPTTSMADGRTYDSKSRYRAELKALGFVELGNDSPAVTDPRAPGAGDETLAPQLARAMDRQERR